MPRMWAVPPRGHCPLFIFGLYDGAAAGEAVVDGVYPTPPSDRCVPGGGRTAETIPPPPDRELTIGQFLCAGDGAPAATFERLVEVMSSAVGRCPGREQTHRR